MATETTLDKFIPVISAGIGGIIALAGTFVTYFFKEQKESRQFDKTKAIYHKLLVQEFEKSILILERHDWTSNPFKDIDYSFFKKNRFQFAIYIPDEMYEYGEFLKQCESMIHAVENSRSIDDLKTSCQFILDHAKIRLKYLYSLNSTQS